MRCSNCESTVVPFALDESLESYAPSGAEALGLCPRCLSLETVDPSIVEDDPAFSRIAETFPEGPAGPATALFVGLLDSLALNRSAIEALIERIETDGVDPLLLLDRLDNQGSVDPRWDVGRRRHQVEQLLERQDF